MKGLVCRECGAQYPEILIHACEKCFGPLEVSYDFDAIEITRDTISGRERNLWRYRELLPILEESSIVDIGTGFSTLHRCKNLADSLELKNLYVKDDTVNPTNSFKDRPSSVAVSKAREFGAEAVGCPSTGNLAAAVAAHAAKAGLPCYVFVPANTESNKVLQARARRGFGPYRWGEAGHRGSWSAGSGAGCAGVGAWRAVQGPPIR